jgi:hypothetical protein
MQLQKLTGAALAAMFVFLLAPAPTAAKGGGHGQGGGAVKPAKTAKPTMKVSAKAHASRGKGQTQRAAAKTTKVTTKSAQRAAKSTPPAGSKKTRTVAVKGETIGKGGFEKPTDPTTPNKAQQKLAQNTNLRAKLQARLPAGTDINAAAAGFRNLGQFVAAVNVAHNQGISFDALRQRMTGPEPMSLGQALQQVKGLNGAVASTTAQTALALAEADIQATTTTSTPRKPAKRRS